MEDVFIQFGVGGCFAILILQIVFRFLERRKNGGQTLTGIQQQLEEMKDWRDVVECLRTLTTHIQVQSGTLETLVEEIRDLRRKMWEVDTK